MKASSVKSTDPRPLFKVLQSAYNEDVVKIGDVVEGVLLKVDSPFPALGFYPPSNKKGTSYGTPLYAAHRDDNQKDALLLVLTDAADRMVKSCL